MTAPRLRTVATALISVSVLALTACTTGAAPQPPQSAAASTTVTAAYEQEFSAYNNSTGSSNSVANQVVLNQVLPSLWDFAADGQVRQLSDFGSYEKTSDAPLTVEYHVSDKAVWSDGDPIDCDDFVLQWAAMSGRFPDAGFDPSSTAGLEDMQQPQCAEGDRDITVVYDKPYADWATALGGGTNAFMPAHIVEKQTSVPSIVAAASAGTADELTAVATFWNTAWSFDPGELKPEISPSSGPYLLDSWVAGESLTLTANPAWWGAKPASDTVVLRFIPQAEQAQALQNGDVQIAKPQPNADVLNQLAAAGSQIRQLHGNEYRFEQLTFNFEGTFADPDLRRAFALCVPREEIVDKLIRPVNPESSVLQSRFVFDFQPGYDHVAAAVQDGSYDVAHREQAQQLMAGRPRVDVRLGALANNKRRTDTIALIKASCDQVGFNVIDSSSPTFHDEGGGLDTGDFDVALFAWSGSPLVTNNYAIYTSTGTQNKGRYRNDQVDKLLAQLNQSTDPAEQRQLITAIDTQLWNDLVSIPLFSFPGVVAYSSSVTGVQFQPAQSDLTWNMQEWAATN